MTAERPAPDAASTRRSRRAAATAGTSGDSASPTSRRERRAQEQERSHTQHRAQAHESASTQDRAHDRTHAQNHAKPRAQDEFTAAAAALNFTGEGDTASSAPNAARPSRQERRRAADERKLHTPFRRFAAATASVAAVGAIALLAVGVSLPLAGTATGGHATASMAEPKSVTTPATQDTTVESQLQGYVAGDDVEEVPLERVEGYEAATYSEIAAVSGISTSGAFFDNDPTADIQWPFAVGTSMSSPFGYRWGRLHEGVDFTPGSGAPVQAIADGVVRTASEAGGAYGVNVYIDHVIDGELVTSHYAHMQYGSLEVVSGQRVEVGDTIGLTGNTGRSYGAHLHFEIRYNDTAIDPLPWLREHANRHYSKEEQAEVAELETDLLGQDFTE